MLLYPESTFQLCSSRRFCEVFKDLFRFPGSRPDAHQSATSVWTMRTFRPNAHQCVQDCIRPDVMVNRPDALQSSRKSQCFSASVRTTWLYRPDAIQCLTRIRVSASRHSYGKTAATIRTMSSIRQERAYKVQTSGDESQIFCIWTPQFTLVKPLVLLFSNVLCEF
jgi:hypothetical protein